MRGSRLVGAILESGLSAKVDMGDGQRFFIEPVSSKVVNNRFPALHVVYRSSDARTHGCTCGLEDHPLGPSGNLVNELQSTQRKPKRQGSQQDGYPEGGLPSLQVAELAVDADFEYFTDYGTEQATLDRMELIVNIVNDQYESEVSLRHVISVAVVRTTEPDPYDSSDSLVMLNEFRNEWINNQQEQQRDVAHLFTGKDLNSNIIGRAWTIGGICNSSAYCLSQSDFNGNLGCATDLTAHELGHLWNGSHCNCTSHTMNPFIVCANNFNPVFTIPSIVAYRNTLNCLDDVVATPENDDWNNSINLIGPDFSTSGTNIDATTQADEQQLDNVGSTVWWYFDADSDEQSPWIPWEAILTPSCIFTRVLNPDL